MLKTPCPFPDCNHPEMPPPSNGYGECPKCGRSSRASVIPTLGGDLVRYSATAKPAKYIKDTFSIRPDQQEWLAAGGNKSAMVRWAIDYAREHGIPPTIE